MAQPMRSHYASKLTDKRLLQAQQSDSTIRPAAPALPDTASHQARDAVAAVP